MSYGYQRPHYNNRGRNYGRNYGRRPFVPATKDKEETVKYPGLPPFVQNLDAHLVRLVRIVQGNDDIRRYISLGIINRLIKSKAITEGGNYIRFRWDKFTVCSKGINTDYRYSDPIFLQSFVGSFTILTNVASKALENFVKIEFDKSAKEVIDRSNVDEDGADSVDKELIEKQLDADENLGVFEEQQ